MDQTPPPLNPLAVDPARVAREEQHRLRTEMAIGAARKAEDWFDIYISVVEQGAMKMAEDNGDGPAVLERIKDQRGTFAEVRHVLQYQGLPLDERMEWEGPHYLQNESGFYHGLEWPRGEWICVTWPDRDKVEMRGQKAVVLATFLLWWQQFQQLHEIQAGALAGTEGKRRMIEPGSPEWNRYFTDKAADLARIERQKRGDA